MRPVGCEVVQRNCKTVFRRHLPTRVGIALRISCVLLSLIYLTVLL